jgi:flagellar biosynthesis chaperone FliJ
MRTKAEAERIVEEFVNALDNYIASHNAVNKSLAPPEILEQAREHLIKKTTALINAATEIDSD